MRRLRVLLGALAIGLVTVTGAAEAKDSFKSAWSIYVGWMPWGWAADNGIVKKWADKYGIEIDVVQINDYVELINQDTAGGFDGCVMTNWTRSRSRPWAASTARPWSSATSPTAMTGSSARPPSPWPG